MTDDKLRERLDIRPVMNGTLTRGWQIWRDGTPISGLFDKHSDALAALNEFRDQALATYRESVKC